MTAVVRRVGRPLTLLVGAGLAAGALLDLVSGPGVALVGHLAVAALALRALHDLPARRRRADAATAAAAALSLAGTPVLVLLGGVAFGFVETGALLLLLVSRWRYAATRTDRLLTGAVLAALAALPLRLWGGDAAFVALLVVTAVAVAVAVAVALRSSDAAHQVLVGAVRRAEREEVARELHDVVAHHVTGIVVATQAARTVAGSDPEAVSAALASIEGAGAEALSAMRRLVGVLRSDVGDDAAGGAVVVGQRLPTPGLGDVPDLVQRFGAASVAGAVELVVPDGAPGAAAPLPVEVQAAAYRVVQESLTNVARHARGTAAVTVRVAGTATALEVEVADRGGPASTAPADPEVRGGGFGIIGMRERVEALGGTLGAGPAPDGGWCVHARIPLPVDRVAPAERRSR